MISSTRSAHTFWPISLFPLGLAGLLPGFAGGQIIDPATRPVIYEQPQPSPPPAQAARQEARSSASSQEPAQLPKGPPQETADQPVTPFDRLELSPFDPPEQPAAAAPPYASSPSAAESSQRPHKRIQPNQISSESRPSTDALSAEPDMSTSPSPGDRHPLRPICRILCRDGNPHSRRRNRFPEQPLPDSPRYQRPILPSHQTTRRPYETNRYD